MTGEHSETVSGSSAAPFVAPAAAAAGADCPGGAAPAAELCNSRALPGPRPRRPRLPAAAAALLALLLACCAPRQARGQVCSTTIQYGASIGDPTRAAAQLDLPIFVGSFSVLTQDPRVNVSSWVLGWQFAAGERIQLQRDVFGDPGIFDVFLSGPQDDAAAAGAAGTRGGPQRAAVFSTTHLVAGPDSDVSFNFVGRKGPDGASAAAPFRVAPPHALFLNNLYCWPLGAAAGQPGVPRRRRGDADVAAPAVASPPRLLQVEFLPIELVGGAPDDQGSALFATTYLQFYFKLTLNATAAPVPLDRVTLRYYFQGPEDLAPPPSAAAGGPNATAAAEMAAAQFRASCTDATPAVGCANLRFNVSVALPGVRGAHYVLSIGFAPGTPPLVPSPDPLTAAAAAAAGNASGAAAHAGLQEVEAIVTLEPRRFFADMGSTADYSWLDTPRLPEPPRSGGGANSSNATDPAPGSIVRRARGRNLRMPAYIGGALAWGSPPVGRPAPGGEAAGSGAAAAQPLPPGSYCRQQPGGGERVCGVSMTYCCLGTAPLATSVPQDWPERLYADDSGALEVSQIQQLGVGGPGGSNTTTPAGGGGGSNSSAAPGGTSSGGGGAEGGAAGGGSATPVRPATVALAVALPVVAVLAALGGMAIAMLRRRRRRNKRRLTATQRLLASESASASKRSRRRTHSSNNSDDDPSQGGDPSGRGAGRGPPGSGSGAGSEFEEGSLVPPLAPPVPGRRSSGPGAVARTLSSGAGWVMSLLGVAPTGPAAAGGGGGPAPADPTAGLAAANSPRGSSSQAGGGSGARSPGPLLPVSNPAWALSPPPSTPRGRSQQQQQMAQLGPPPLFPITGSSVRTAVAGALGSPQPRGSPSPRFGGSPLAPTVLSPIGLLSYAAGRIAAAAGGRGGPSDDEAAAAEAPRPAPGAKFNTLPAWFGSSHPGGHYLGSGSSSSWMSSADAAVAVGAEAEGPEAAAEEGAAAAEAAADAGGGLVGRLRARSRRSLEGWHSGATRPWQTWGGRLHDDAFPNELLDPLYISTLVTRRRTALGLPPSSGPSLTGPAAAGDTAGSSSGGGGDDSLIGGQPVAARTGSVTGGGQLVPRTGSETAHSPFAAQLVRRLSSVGPEGDGGQWGPQAARGRRRESLLPPLPAAGGAAAAVMRPPLPPPPAAAALAAALAADPHTLTVQLLGCCRARAERRRAAAAAAAAGASGSTPPTPPSALPAAAGTSNPSQQQQQQLLQGAQGASPPSSQHSGCSLLKNGMLWLPGEPPVPLNVDFESEIRPALGRVLGRGGYGVVYEAEWRGQAVAVKVLSVDSDEMHEAFLKEVALSACFRRSPRVVKLLGACLEDKSRMALIMELCEGNLAQRIYSPSKRRLDTLETLQIGADIAAGLAYLHPSVVHRDLKPQNVLLDRAGRAKIGDFGISRFKDPRRSYLSVTHAGGTPNYMAPELFSGSRVDEAADVYSLGCVLYECLARRQPFSDLAGPDGSKTYNLLFKIIVAVAIAGERPLLPEDAPPRLADLIARCWREDPRERPGVREVLESLEEQIDEEVEARAERTGLLRHIRKSLSRANSGGGTPSGTPTEEPGNRVDSAGPSGSNDGSRPVSRGGGGSGSGGAAAAAVAAGAADTLQRLSAWLPPSPGASTCAAAGEVQQPSPAAYQQQQPSAAPAPTASTAGGGQPQDSPRSSPQQRQQRPPSAPPAADPPPAHRPVGRSSSSASGFRSGTTFGAVDAALLAPAGHLNGPSSPLKPRQPQPPPLPPPPPSPMESAEGFAGAAGGGGGGEGCAAPSTEPLSREDSCGATQGGSPVAAGARSPQKRVSFAP